MNATIPCWNMRRAFGNIRALSAVILALAGTGCGSGSHIRVETDPPGAALTCDGQTFPDTPHTLTGLRGGTYFITAAKAGYREARQVVTIQDGQRVTVRLPLEPIRGLALVRSTPPGAEVTVNGAFRGRTPFFITDLAHGEHRFVFQAEGYLSRELDVMVEDPAPQLVETALTQNAGRLVIRSEPSGAQVRVNGADRGLTPLELDGVPAGDPEVEILMPGYVSARERVPLEVQETREISLRLQPLPTQLNLVSIPAGARIYVDNEFRGETPLELRDLPAGSRRVRAELRGFEPLARTVDLTANQPRTEEFRLTKNSGKLVVVTEPPDAKVFLNGEELGVTRPSDNAQLSLPLELDLIPPGSHILQLSRPGYRHRPSQITMQSNAIVSRHERMERIFVVDTRVRLTNGIVRDGMLLKRYPNGKVDLQLETGTVLSIDGTEILSVEPAPGTRAPN
ncbi:MAG: PEGA domain-containing protein [Kiritimatiellae bacterium]|nr:PEGA domain-containing protein [Kiritimatiellia bacterium]